MKVRLKQSIEKGYFFEALFILSSMIENHCKNKCKELQKIDRVSFEESIAFIAAQNVISVDLSHRLHQWRDVRNKIVHALMDDSIEESTLISVVTEGSTILNILDGTAL